MPPYAYQVTKYDPADRDERGGYYTGPEDSLSDHGAVEAAYLESVAAFAAETGVDWLAIREPELPGIAHFGLEPAIPGHGLAGVLREEDYHDGAVVAVETGLELVRAMLRDNGAWCRLEAGDRFLVHVGYDRYLYIGSDRPCERAVARARALGLFPEPIDASPYTFDPANYEQRRPADDAFWERVAEFVARGRAGVLEERPVQNVSRWHPLEEGGVEAVRRRLTPRACLAVWPKRPDKYEYELAPLLAGVLPDVDGVLRARWGTERDLHAQ
jgi:small subunit ribosomal protein S1